MITTEFIGYLMVTGHRSLYTHPTPGALQVRCRPQRFFITYTSFEEHYDVAHW